MIDFSFNEKLLQLKDTIMSSSFFLFSLIIGVILLIIIIIGIKKNRKINKIIFIISWLFVLSFFIIKYFSSFISIFDRLFGRIVEEIYFPSLSIYTCVFIIVNIIFILSLFKKNIDSIFRIINIILSMIFDFLFIMIIDIVDKNNLDIYNSLELYNNPALLVLLEFSMFLFITWIFVNCIIVLIRKYAIKKEVISTYKEHEYEIVDINNEKFDDEIINLDDEIEILDM